MSNLRTTKSESYVLTGMGLYDIDADNSYLSVIEGFLKPLIQSELYENLKEQMEELPILEDRTHTLFIYTDLGFDVFNAVAVCSKSKEDKYSERNLFSNVIYTTDEGFSQKDIPKYNNSRKVAGKEYSKEKIYCIRIVQEDIVIGFKEITEDICLFIPSSYFIIL